MTILSQASNFNIGLEDRAINSTGSSEASSNIQRILRDNFQEIKKNTITWSQYSDAIQDLREIYLETREKGWDGYDADIISDATFEQANAFINSLPTWVIFPEIIPDCDGSIGFQWTSLDKNKVFVACIYQDGIIQYASLKSAFDTDHGTKLFDGKIPSDIIKKIEDITLA